MVSSTHHNVVRSSPLSPRPAYAQTSSGARYSQSPFPECDRPSFTPIQSMIFFVRLQQYFPRALTVHTELQYSATVRTNTQLQYAEPHTIYIY